MAISIVLVGKRGDIVQEQNIKAHEQQAMPVMLVLQPPAPDAVNLIDLWRTVWRRKAIVFGTMVLVLLASIVYALNASPTYRAEASLLPPLNSNIQQLLDTKAETPRKIYALFVRNLESVSLRKKYFDSHVMDQLAPNHGAADAEAMFAGFNSGFTVQKDPNGNRREHVSYEGPNANMAAKWVNGFIATTNKATVQMLIQNIVAKLNDQKQQIRDEIKAKRDMASRRLQDQIVQLEEASLVAAKAGIKGPLAPVGHQLDANAPLYMLGYKALNAQLAMLKKRRKSNGDAFVPGLLALQEKLAMLDNIQFDPSALSVVTVDQPASVPGHPVKPRRKLIVLVGLVGGLALGILAAFLVDLFCRARATRET